MKNKCNMGNLALKNAHIDNKFRFKIKNDKLLLFYRETTTLRELILLEIDKHDQIYYLCFCLSTFKGNTKEFPKLWSKAKLM